LYFPLVIVFHKISYSLQHINVEKYV
jgi:hypothetical protein